MKWRKSETGKIGEDIACSFLENNGYKIFGRNYRKPWGEIDIVAVAGDKTVIFVEVKTMAQSGNQGLLPEDQMSPAKLKKFRRICESFCGINQNIIDDEKGWRMDLIAIVLSEETKGILTYNDKNVVIKHYENI